MEHIEEAGVHSGDSACSLPPYSLSSRIMTEIKEQTKRLALELRVVGLINIQFAVKNGDVYVLEVNPASALFPCKKRFPREPQRVIMVRPAEVGYKGNADQHTPSKGGLPFTKNWTILGPEVKSTMKSWGSI
jgi:carbamoyl-phosphate synthase large subunit